MRNLKFLTLALGVLAVVSTAATNSGCDELAVPNWNFSSVSQSMTANGNSYFKKYSFVDMDGKDRGYVVLSGIVTNAFPDPMTQTVTYSQDSSTIENTPVDNLFKQAFANGWKLSKVSNTSKTLSNHPCGRSSYLTDTVHVITSQFGVPADGYGFEFRR